MHPNRAAAVTVPRVTDALDLRLVRASTFEPLLNTEFTATDGGAMLRLAAVERHGEQPHAPRREPFALVFTAEPVLDQGTYMLEHPALGRLEVFLVPVGLDAAGRALYEAVFN